MAQPPDPVDTFQLLKAKADDPPNIRALRFAVLGMGVVLLLGFGAVVARIVYLTTRPGPVEAVAPVGGPAQAMAPLTGEVALALPAGAKILSQSLSGNRLAVHYAAAAAESIVVIDLETGKVISKVSISTGNK